MTKLTYNQALVLVRQVLEQNGEFGEWHYVTEYAERGLREIVDELLAEGIDPATRERADLFAEADARDWAHFQAEMQELGVSPTQYRRTQNVVLTEGKTRMVVLTDTAAVAVKMLDYFVHDLRRDGFLP